MFHGARKSGVSASIVGFLLIIASCSSIGRSAVPPDQSTSIDAEFGPAENVSYETSAPVGTWAAISPVAGPALENQATAWTGSHAFFWSGTFGHSLIQPHLGGRMYEPTSGEWTEIDRYAWGGAMMSAAVGDGVVYLATDGGFRSYKHATNEWIELTTPQGLVLDGLAQVGSTIYGFGPEQAPDTTSYTVRAAVYDVESDQWQVKESVEDYHVSDDVLSAGVGLEHPPMVFDESIVLWQTDGEGLIYDTDADHWRSLPALDPQHGTVFDSKAVTTQDGLIAVVGIDPDVDGVMIGARLAVLRNGIWRWLDPFFEGMTSRSISLVPAGDWAMALNYQFGLVAIHMPTGRWLHQPGAPVHEGYSAVWTGDEVVFSGLPINSLDLAAHPRRSATWTPPSAAPDLDSHGECPAAGFAAELIEEMGFGSVDDRSMQSVADRSSGMLRGVLTWSSNIEGTQALELFPHSLTNNLDWTKSLDDIRGEPFLMVKGQREPSHSTIAADYFVGLDFVAFVADPSISDGSNANLHPLDVTPGGLFIGCGPDGEAVPVHAEAPTDVPAGTTLGQLWNNYEPGAG